MAHALDDAGIDTLLTDDRLRAHAFLPGWRTDGISSRSDLQRSAGNWAWQRAGGSPPARARSPTPQAALRTRRAFVCRARRSMPSPGSVAGATASSRHPTPPVRAAARYPARECRAAVCTPAARRAAPAAPIGDGHELHGHGCQRLLGLTRERPDSLILVPELLQALVAAAERGGPVPGLAASSSPWAARVCGRAAPAGRRSSHPVSRATG